MTPMLSGVAQFDGDSGDEGDRDDVFRSSREPGGARRERLGRAEFHTGDEGCHQSIHCLLASSDRLLLGLLTAGDAVGHLSEVRAVSREWLANPDRWQDLIATISGDFAFAVWDRDADALHLGRPPLSQIALYYAQQAGRTTFSTLAPTLARKGAFCIDRLIDMRRTVAPILGSRWTAFGGVHTVQPGTMITFDRTGARETPLLPLRIDRERLSDCADAADRLRTLFMNSVERAISSTTSPLAAQLSGGRDSGLITAAAASMLQRSGGRLLAFTYAPALGFAGSHARYRYDESDRAADIASRYDNIEHHIVRPESFRLTDSLDARHAFMPMPLVALANLHWWDAIEKGASHAGARRLLTGACGNFTVSVGGPWPLSDLLGEEGVVAWLHRVRECRRAPGSSFPALLNMSLGGRLPKHFYRLLDNLRRDEVAAPCDLFLRGDLAQARRKSAADDDPRPGKSFRVRLLEALSTADFADQAGPMLHGVTQYDPTGDRDMAQLSIDLSANLLTSRYDRRPLYESAFGDLVPQSTIRATVKGSQGADWSMVIDPQEVRAGLKRYADCQLVREWIDLPALQKALDDWPDRPIVESAKELLFIKEVLPTISIASFLYVHSHR